MKRPLAYITAAWLGGDSENAELAAQYCRTVYTVLKEVSAFRVPQEKQRFLLFNTGTTLIL